MVQSISKQHMQNMSLSGHVMGSAEDTWRLGIVMVSLPSSSTLRQEGLVWPSTAFARSDEPIRNGYGLQVAMKPKLFSNHAMVVLGKTISPSSAEADLLQEPLGESQKSPLCEHRISLPVRDDLLSQSPWATRCPRANGLTSWLARYGLGKACELAT